MYCTALLYILLHSTTVLLHCTTAFLYYTTPCSVLHCITALLHPGQNIIADSLHPPTPSHYTTLRYATLHYTTLHYTKPYYPKLHYTTLDYTPHGPFPGLLFKYLVSGLEISGFILVC